MVADLIMKKSSRTTKEYQDIAREIRCRILRMHVKSRSSHIGSALSIVDILVCLYFNILKNNCLNPNEECRDRFILSKGHACSALYAILAKRGFCSDKVLEGFCADGGKLLGHATWGNTPGVELSTGSLGHGLSVGIGMALSARYDKKNFRVFVLMGDGECNEGSVWEAAMFAGFYKLDNLVAIIDYNKLQAFGTTAEVMDLEPFADKWAAFGWSVREINGHDCQQIIDSLNKIPFKKNKPSLVIAHTIPGKGVSFMENKLMWHYKSPTEEDLKKALQELA